MLVDRLWDALSAVPEGEQCGWCKDRYGLSWQIVPDVVPRLLADPDPARAERAMQAILGMSARSAGVFRSGQYRSRCYRRGP